MADLLISGVSHGMSHGLRLSQRGSYFWLRVKTSVSSCRIEVSLKTRERVEARRRAARVAVALPYDPTPATVRVWIEAMERITVANMPAKAKAAAEIELDAAARRQALDPLDDPEFRAALEAEAEARGWYGPPDADEVIEHFWAMQAGMDAMTQAYHDACKRKGVDPATREPVARAAVAFKDLANRYLRRRSEGYPCLRKIEAMDEGAGKAFVAGQSGNFLGSASLFVDFLGGDELTEQVCADFVTLLAKVPWNHGKSQRDKRNIRQVVDDTDNKELIDIETAVTQLRKAGAKPGVIEDARAARKIDRLKTGTIVRHARAIATILDWGVILGEVPSNPMRLCIPSAKEITARSCREISGKREGWTPEECQRLFGTPLFVEGPSELDDALFWAPLISAHCGAREEEILQLLGPDVDSRWIRFRITRPETQSLKSEASGRLVPTHSNLVALGLPDLAKRAGSGRLFPGVARSAARGKLSETFTKRFIYYRRKYLAGPWHLPNKVFHAFRGGASTSMLRAKVPLETVQQIIGHDSDETTILHYCDGDSEAMLRDAIEKIEIDVSGVKRLFV